ncbi:hypothetical protein [Bradyrhizobium sp. AUGA SZCCT0283]|uniref:hypothetical protein n=1 Tax=Bradyrhizobium sp. AUGA SZCCT0283 TaxID=2807671 RepID=UPI001BA7A9FF|nr:hypothetical protein [Bradyrhizobium sp. AUGA SZCCT0283]MBR1280044.1 hypothetical protein [Bradyrhizobium sp. AUGA SZCCT0283]
MLQTNRTDRSVNMPPELASPAESLAQVVAFIRRHSSITLLTCCVTIGAAVLYLIAAVPTFTANAELVIDTKAAPGDPAFVSTNVESQIAIIKSQGIARAVIRKLGLAEDPEFAGQAGVVRGMARSISRLLGWRKPETESSAMRYAVESFARKLSVKRVGVTYIVEITFSSPDPDRAAQILSTVADTYIMAPIENYKSAFQSQKWVKDRMNELSSQASAAKKAVADYYKNGKDSAGPVDADALPSQLKASELRELEAAADTATRTYDNFLRMLRYMEEMQQQSSPVFEARLLSEVSRPLTASSPKAGLVLGISIVGGVLLGIAVGMLRDLSDRGIRPSGDGATVSSVVVLQQGEAALANENHTPAALSPLRRQNPREEAGALAAHAGIRRGPEG